MKDDDHGTYEVGNKRPPLANRFKPGQSGNPRGRPRGSRSLKNILGRSACAMVVDTESAETTTQLEALVAARFRSAIRGNDKAAAQILELANLLLDDDDADAA